MIPPHNLEAELDVLGNVMNNPALVKNLKTQVRAEDFYKDVHRRLWLLIMRRHEVGKPTDMISLVDAIMRTGTEASFGGLAYVSSIPERCGVPAMVGGSVAILREYTVRRQGLEVLVSGQEEILKSDDPAWVASSTGQKLAGIAAGQGHRRSVPADILADQIIYDIDAQHDHVDMYIPTGWEEWDYNESWQGLSTEGMTLVIARSGMGKTSFLNSLAVQLAIGGYQVYIHGTETSAKLRAHTMIQGMAGVSRSRWSWVRKHGEPGEREACRRRLIRAAEWFHQLPIHITGAGMTVEEFAHEARTLKAAGELDVLLADYLQDFTRSRGVSGDMTEQTNHNSKALKDLSAELAVPLVAGAQVSGEKLTDIPPAAAAIPLKTHVQHSSKAHQDADVIVALNCGNYWCEAMGRTPAQHDTSYGPLGVMQVVRRKSRTAPGGMIQLPWNGPRRWVGTPPVLS